MERSLSFFSQGESQYFEVGDSSTSEERFPKRIKSTPRFVPPLKRSRREQEDEMTPHAFGKENYPDAVNADPNCSSSSEKEESTEPPSLPVRRFKLRRSKHRSQVHYSLGVLGNKETSHFDRVPTPKRPRPSLSLAHRGQASCRASNNTNNSNLNVFSFPESQSVDSQGQSEDITDNASIVNQRLSMSLSGRSYEQQLAIDLEVLEVIARMRREMEEVRRRHACLPTPIPTDKDTLDSILDPSQAASKTASQPAQSQVKDISIFLSAGHEE